MQSTAAKEQNIREAAGLESDRSTPIQVCAGQERAHGTLMWQVRERL
jgi:hypothetical protein